VEVAVHFPQAGESRLHQLRKSLNILCVVIAAGISFFADANPVQQDQTGATSTNISASALWRDRGDIASLDLFYGAGSPEREPTGTFIFAKELSEGATPKFEVVDQRGVHWIAKVGHEAKAETAATRLVWAAGYFTDEAYYVSELSVEKMPKLSRITKFASKTGAFQSVRLERVRGEHEKIGNWSWSKNPFSGTKEMNGLRVMMALINNWDLRKENNAIYSVNGQTYYAVSDLGGCFGKTGGVGSRTKNRLDDYAESKFIDEIDSDVVDLTLKSRPFFLLAVDPYHYNKLASREKIGKEIPRADAKWLGELLGRLSIEQIRDCFRAAGYTPDEVDGFAGVVHGRIRDLNQL
jgi:hypothetical protein